MNKLYMVRRNSETLIGPLSASALKAGLSSMEFGLEDEVCGHLGRWLKLSDVKRIQSRYPELASIVKKAKTKEWGVSQSDFATMQDTALSAPSPRSRRRSSSPLSLLLRVAVTLLLVCALGGVGLKVAAPQVWFSLQAEWLALDPAELEQLGLNQPQELQALHRKNRAVFAQLFKLEGPDQAAWQRVGRLVAFSGAGRLPGVSYAQLKGRADPGAPKSCSLEEWKQRWLRLNHKGLKRLLIGPAVKAPHQVLSWDPHWLARRPRVDAWTGWLNYHHACLQSAMAGAELALQDSASTNKARKVLAIVSMRLRLMVDTTAEFLASGRDQDQRETWLRSSSEAVDIRAEMEATFAQHLKDWGKDADARDKDLLSLLHAARYLNCLDLSSGFSAVSACKGQWEKSTGSAVVPTQMKRLGLSLLRSTMVAQPFAGPSEAGAEAGKQAEDDAANATRKANATNATNATGIAGSIGLTGSTGTAGQKNAGADADNPQKLSKEQRRSIEALLAGMEGAETEELSGLDYADELAYLRLYLEKSGDTAEAKAAFMALYPDRLKGL